VRREVVRHMPLYEVKAMIDTLYFYTHPMLDLTQHDDRIPSLSTPSVCLSVWRRARQVLDSLLALTTRPNIGCMTGRAVISVLQI
jgi:hypothetical protein